ncbi:MAG: DNA translocase FtsK 4TM domain-containing protein [Janthinobacterium lividum]
MQLALPSRFIPERFASPQLQASIRRRLAELGGVALAAIAIAMLVALVSYNPRDPSPDTATMVQPSNMAGPVGAAFADLMLQYFGVAGLLPVLALLAWAWRIASRGGLGSLTLRLVALVFVLPVSASVLAGAPMLLPHAAATGPLSTLTAPVTGLVHAGWPGAAGFGGAVGISLGQAAIDAGRGALGAFGGVLVWLLTLALAILLIPLCLGLSAREWRAMGRGVHRTARYPIARAGRQNREDTPRRSLLSRFTRRSAGPVARTFTDEDDFDHVMPGESPFAADAMRANGRATSNGRGHADSGTAGYGALVAQDAPARPRVDRKEPSLLGGRSEKPAARPKLGSSGWVLPPGAAEEPDDMPVLPMRSRSAIKATRAPLPESPPIRLGAPVDDAARYRTPEQPVQPDEQPAAVVPKTGGMLSIARLLGTREPAPQRPPGPVQSRSGPTGPGLFGSNPSSGSGSGNANPPAQQARKPVHPDDAQWRLPPLSLLKPAPPRESTGPSAESMHANARLLETVLSDYGVQGAIGDIHAGPVVTLYELEPAPGIRSARVIGLADDIARSLSVTAVRIATVPGRNVIGIEVPNAKRETVYFSELLDSDAWVENPARLCLALGKDISGAPVYADLARMPHLLIAGTTGSGKSVGINSMILSLLYRLSPEECRLIMIDPKMLELSIYDGIPHLMAPVVTDPAKAVMALKWTVREMERRYRGMSQLGVRNIAGYNERTAAARASGETMTRKVQTGFDPETGRPIFEEQNLSLENLPYIVVVIDEMADLMMVAGKEIEITVQRLAQMARAAGIHVIMATQRPSVDVITGTIKANFPTRISFQVISKFDSRTILGEGGSEQLLGQGDMLYMAGGGRITRVHGPFVGDLEVEDVVRHLRAQGEPVYVDEVTAMFEDDGGSGSSGGSGGGSGNGLGGGGFDGDTALFDQAVALVAREGKASTSFIQRHLSIGYNRAAKLIEQMEKDGIVSSANHVGKREVLVRRAAPEED